jgi:excisionase family DNA binding protein
MEDILKRLNDLEKILKENLLQRKDVFTVDEAAVYMNLSKPTLYKLTSEKKISYHKPYGKVYFKRSDCDNFMLSNRQPSNQELADNTVHFLTTKERRAV